MKQIFHKPAQVWQEGFPVGNGRLGAVVYGDPHRELIKINEDTLWSGYPQEKYGGISMQLNMQAGEMCKMGKYVEATRLIEKELEKAEDVQMYVPFGNIFFEFLGERHIDNYRRELNLEEAVIHIQYYCNNRKYEHICFSSAPAQAIVYKISSEESFSIRIGVEEGFINSVVYEENGFWAFGECPGKNAFTVTEGNESNGKLQFSDVDKERGMRYVGQGKIRSAGSCTVEQNGLLLHDTKEIIFYFCVRTSFNGYNRHPFCEGKELRSLLAEDMKRAEVSFSRLLDEHICDYKNYFDRVSLKLGTDEKEEMDLDERICRMEQGEEDIALCALLFDFGRYLLISSSRPDTQAANLQGIWNQEKIPPWFCDYTVNINTQMNYWMTGPCNLDEMAEPLVRLNEELLENGKKTANIMGKRGIACFHNVDLWRKTSPATGNASWAYWPFGAAWMCRNLFEGYLFSKDRQYLLRIFPILKENVKFCVDMLETTSEGLAVCPATSPENDFIVDGHSVPVAYYTENTVAIIRNLLQDYIESCETLGMDEMEIEKNKKILHDIVPVKIGTSGQILEWNNEFMENDIHHRHLSHLYELHPGRGISADTPDLYRAAEVTLRRRGDEGTGWSLAWKLLMWARMENGQHFEKVMRKMFHLVDPSAAGAVSGGGLYANMFCAHPPFQIDGNLGYTAGIAEALLQSHNCEIVILPALPPAWKNGSIKGLRARGNIKVNILWNREEIKYELLSECEQIVYVRVMKGTVESVLLKSGQWYKKSISTAKLSI